MPSRPEVNSVLCPHCQGHIHTDREAAGMVVSCPHGSEAFQMPPLQPREADLPASTHNPTEDEFHIDTSAAEMGVCC